MLFSKHASTRGVSAGYNECLFKRSRILVLCIVTVGLLVALAIINQYSVLHSAQYYFPEGWIPMDASSVKLFRDERPFSLQLSAPEDRHMVYWFQHSTGEQRIGTVIRTTLLAASQDGAFVDVGLNRGYFTLLAARLGFHVVGVEVMTGCVNQVTANLRQNRLDARIINAGVARASGSTVDGGGQCNEHVVSQVDRDILFMKMDIEGSEINALLGFGVQGFLKFRVANLVVETMSHLWPAESKPQGLALLQDLALASAAVYCIDPTTEASYYEAECGFPTFKSTYFGTLHTVPAMSMATAIRRPNSCCGNLWFHDIGGKSI